MTLTITRREFTAAIGGAAVWPTAARSQQATSIPRIGFLSQSPRAGPNVASLKDGLRELGLVDGQNVAFDYRFAAGRLGLLASLADDLVRSKVDVIATAATPAARAAQRATSTIPIVIVDPGDPVELGLVQSLARPGGNITGQVSIAPDLASKRLALLKETAPTISRVAVMWNAAIPPAEVALKELRAAAATLKVDILPVEIHEPQEFASSFATIARGHADGLFVFPDPLTFNSERSIADLANEHRIPAMFGDRQFVDAGGLISYGPSYADMWRRAGYYVGRILKGTKPSDLPVEQPTKFELIINSKTAKALGLPLPATLLALADEVIE
jgi:putative ABC transport system substrate-binding protein